MAQKVGLRQKMKEHKNICMHTNTLKNDNNIGNLHLIFLYSTNENYDIGIEIGCNTH
jgi:hypothetical protein